MMKLLKWIGIVVGVVVVLVIGAAVTIPMFISVDTYKGEIISQVKSNTGRISRSKRVRFPLPTRPAGRASRW